MDDGGDKDGAGDAVVVLVAHGKEQFSINVRDMDTVGDLRARLCELTNVEVENQRLIFKSTILSDDDAELLSLKLKKKNKMKLMGTTASTLEDMKKAEELLLRREEAQRAARDEIRRHLQAIHARDDKPITLFERIEPLPGYGGERTSTEQAHALLERLAYDPNIVAIMQKHNWRVGVLKEFAPGLDTGMVGVTDSCLLGYNMNKGQAIALRLRTDDFEGFRHYHVIINTLLHELAHMVHSPHDKHFWALFRQLRQEYSSLHWTSKPGHQLVGSPSNHHHHTLSTPSDKATTPTPTSTATHHEGHVVGGAFKSHTKTPAQAARDAAMQRLKRAKPGTLVPQHKQNSNNVTHDGHSNNAHDSNTITNNSTATTTTTTTNNSSNNNNNENKTESLLKHATSDAG